MKSIQRTLKQLQAESNKRDAKLYRNMFACLTKDSSQELKASHLVFSLIVVLTLETLKERSKKSSA